MDRTPRIRVAILPSIGMGHLIPLVEFAKQLILQHNFSVTLILPTDGPLSKAQSTFLDSLPSTGCIDYLLLPPVNFDDLEDGIRIETRISLTIARSLPSLREALKSLVATTTSNNTKLAALVVDLFGTDAFDVADEFNLSRYIFFTSTATLLSFFLHLPRLHDEVSCEFRDLTEPVKLPGCVPLHGRDLLDPAQDRENDAYKWLLHHARRYSLAEGVLVNSFQELEAGPFKALLQENDKEPTMIKLPVYPVGPLIQRGLKDREEDLKCLKWLDDQPSESVLFVSFGSGRALSHNQLIEVAFGLEMSEQRFLWVVQSPNDAAGGANSYTDQSQDDPLAFMPEGFLERIEGRGFLIPSWAPQAKILAHGSTGGFLTHCGWNSTLESVVEGVPLIAWPFYAEQKMNAVMLVEDLQVALRPEANIENGNLVGRVEIANVVKALMEGAEVRRKRLRSRMKELKDAAAMVLNRDGSSTQALAQVARKWQTKFQL